MPKKSTIKKSLTVFMLMAVALAAVSVLPTAFAQSGLINPSDNPELISNVTGGEGDAKSLAKTILNFILGFLGFVAVIFIIYGGFLYVASGGNDEQTQKGRKIILHSIIGIVIILASFAIVNTVLKAPAGTSSSTTTTTAP